MVDVEGNGQQPPNLVEAAVVSIVGGMVGQTPSWLVRPPRPITAMARRFHRITNEEVAGRPPVAEVAQEIRRELDGAVLVAHNTHVDLGVLVRELPGFTPTRRVIDTLKLARKLLPSRASYKLGALAADLELACELPEGLRPHRVEYDALACARLLFHMATLSKAAPPRLADLLTTPAVTGGEGDGSAALF